MEMDTAARDAEELVRHSTGPDGYLRSPVQDPNRPSADHHDGIIREVAWSGTGVLDLTGSEVKFMMDQNRELTVASEEPGITVKKEVEEKIKEEETPPPEENESKNVESQVEPAIPPVEPATESAVESTIEPPVEAAVEVPEVSDKDWPDGTLAAGYSLCQNCGIRGQTEKFIRAGKFCSSDCAKSSALTVKSLACGGNSSLTGKTHDSAFHQHRKLNNQLYKPSNKSNSDQASNTSLHNDSILRKQRPNNYPIQSTRQSNNLVNQSRLNSDSNVEGVSRSQKRSFDSSENHFASKHRGHSSKKSKLKHRHALSLKSIESLVHDNNISSLLDSNSITNDSEKLSLPSSPASSLVNITPGSALYQSIFAMKIQQHQQEPPLGWDKHSKNLANIINSIKPSDVLKWNSLKVGEFVNSIPGCAHFGRSFMDQMIDGEALLLLTQSDLVRHLDIKLGPAIKIHNTIILIRDAMEV